MQVLGKVRDDGNDNDIDLSSSKVNKRKVFLSRVKRKLLKHIWILRGALFLGIVALFCLIIFLFSNLIKRTKLPYYSSLIKNFVFVPRNVVKEIEGRTNILILGKGGNGHEAPDLTDTILLLSLDRNSRKITIISLPRDIWISPLRTKLNSLYYWGNKKEVGGGVILAKSSVEEILGQHVHYAVVLDFSGFKEIIDALGGIEVDVENSFTDEKYPIPGKESDLCGGDPEYKCRYETVSFKKGKQFMDGETALKFARSRNAEGDEGTDFARQKRQQKIVEAIKDKILDKNIILSPRKLLQLKNVFFSAFETDITESEGVILARMIFDARNNTETFVIPENLLENPPKSSKYDNLYVFIPKRGNWSEVQNWVKCLLKGGSCSN